MDQGFNDKELADIMNEIENLEKEFGQGTHSSAGSTDNQVLAELAQKTVEESVLKTNSQSSVMPFSAPQKKSGSATSSMTFKVEGQMNINLSFEIGTESVSLLVGEDGLTINLLNGTCFKVPIKNATSFKKSA
jgi:hypothetical protein